MKVKTNKLRFKVSVLAVALGIVVSGASIASFFVESAEAVAVNSLPPDVQQHLNFMWAQFPAFRQLDIVAIQALSPQKAQQAVNNIRMTLNTYPRDVLVQLAGIAEMIRQSLPPGYQQAFVNGLWGVSPAEEQFVNQIVRQLQALQNAGGTQADEERRGMTNRWVERQHEREMRKWENWGRERENSICSVDNRYSFCRNYPR